MSEPEEHSSEAWETFQPLISYMIQQKASVVVSCSDLKFSFATYILRQDQDTLTLKNTVPLEHIHEVIYQEKFQLALPDIQLFTEKLAGDGVDFLFKIQGGKSFSSSRKFERARTESMTRAYIQYKNPYDQQTIYQKKVVTLSEGGLSFETNAPSLLLYPGQDFADVKIHVDGHLVRQGTIQLVYCKKYFDTESREKYQVGAMFLSGDGEVQEKSDG